MNAIDALIGPKIGDFGADCLDSGARFTCRHALFRSATSSPSFDHSTKLLRHGP